MNRISLWLWDCHPLFHLRKVPILRWALEKADIPVFSRVYGINFKVMCRLMSHIRMITGWYEHRELNNFLYLARGNHVRIFWDIGANIGIYSYCFITSVPNGTAKMFEPDPRNIGLIERTVKRNRLQDRLSIVPTAVSDRDGRAHFLADGLTGLTGSLDRDRTGQSFLTRHAQGQPEALEVDVTTLDQAATLYAPPDCLKIDTEGGERDILLGGRETIRRHLPMIMVEVSSNNDEVAALLTDAGYEMFDMTTLAPIREPAYNTLALHPSRHRFPHGPCRPEE